METKCFRTAPAHACKAASAALASEAMTPKWLQLSDFTAFALATDGPDESKSHQFRF